MEMRVERQPEVLFVCVHNAGRSQMAAVLTAALSDGVPVHPFVLPDSRAVLRDYCPAGLSAPYLCNEILDRTGNEADVLTLGLIRGYEAGLASYLTNLGLRVAAYGEERLSELVLTTGVEEVALILFYIPAPRQVIPGC